MNLDEYAEYDETGLADLVRQNEVKASELHSLAAEASNKVNPEINAAATATFPEPLPYDSAGRFAGAPFAVKDLVCHAEVCQTGCR